MEELVVHPGAQVTARSRWGWCSAALGPPDGPSHITGIRIGFAEPEAANPPVPPDRSQTRPPHRRPASKPGQADKKTRRIAAALKAKRRRQTHGGDRPTGPTGAPAGAHPAPTAPARRGQL